LEIIVVEILRIVLSRDHLAPLELMVLLEVWVVLEELEPSVQVDTVVVLEELVVLVVVVVECILEEYLGILELLEFSKIHIQQGVP
jgi:hypothetical protein